MRQSAQRFLDSQAPDDEPILACIFLAALQYDFGKPSTFSAMKLRMSCGLIGAIRGIRDSRR
jgi:hypothetical protein